MGALLSVGNYNASVHYLPYYDGSGNIAGYLDHNELVVAAELEYSPFGRLIRENYDDWYEEYLLSDLLFSFSTKMRIFATESYNYGHRLYNSRDGRFINQDPIGEAGGVNLYAFVGNDPVNRWDYLGLDMMGEDLSRHHDSRPSMNPVYDIINRGGLEYGYSLGAKESSKGDEKKRSRAYNFRNSAITVAGGTRYDFRNQVTIAGTQGIRAANDFAGFLFDRGIEIGNFTPVIRTLGETSKPYSETSFFSTRVDLALKTLESKFGKKSQIDDLEYQAFGQKVMDRNEELIRVDAFQWTGEDGEARNDLRNLDLLADKYLSRNSIFSWHSHGSPNVGNPVEFMGRVLSEPVKEYWSYSDILRLQGWRTDGYELDHYLFTPNGNRKMLTHEILKPTVFEKSHEIFFPPIGIAIPRP